MRKICLIIERTRTIALFVARLVVLCALTCKEYCIDGCGWICMSVYYEASGYGFVTV